MAVRPDMTPDDQMELDQFLADVIAFWQSKEPRDERFGEHISGYISALQMVRSHLQGMVRKP